MEVHLKIIGILLILLSVLHVFFPRYFKWKTEMEAVSLINKQMMYVHTFFLSLIVLLMGIICVCNTTDLMNTRLGRQLSLGFSVFWGIRLIFQFFVYSSKLWKGKLFETVIHVVFSLLWAYLTLVFFVNYW